jgi:hypothetical protein
MERFWNKVNKTDGCWEWTASLNQRGYGQFKFEGKMVKAHRYSITLDGRDPTGKLVCHHCDNPKCVRPDHLFVGTDKDNMVDMVKKGRNSKILRKLTIKDAEDIRLSNLSQTDLAKMYDVSESTISRIVNHKRYLETS